MRENQPIRVTAARENARDDAAALGIDHDFIGLLVDSFYDRIRLHEELGPIFNEAIGDNWGPHLDTMKRFWASVALHDASYSGRPVPAHMKLEGLNPGMFATWLNLFETTLNDIAPTPDTPAFFMERARRIANSLQLNIFYNPATSARPT
jgi:hemoglobin